jgi:hypothetical protein
MMRRLGGRRGWVIAVVAVVVVVGGAIWYSVRGTSRTAKATVSEPPRPTQILPSRVVLDASGLVQALPDLTQVVGSAVRSGLVKPTDQRWTQMPCSAILSESNGEYCELDHPSRSAPRIITVNIKALSSVAEGRQEITLQRQHGSVDPVKETTGAVDQVPQLADDAFSTRYEDGSSLSRLPSNWWLGGALLAARFRNVVLDVTCLGPAYVVQHDAKQAPPVPTGSYAQDRQEAIALMRLLIARLS